jgi:hypothetical protein
MRLTQKLAIAIVLTVAMVGCSKKQSRREAAREFTHRAYEGQIFEAVKANYDSPALSNCDLRYKDRVLKLAKELDERHEEIQAASRLKKPRDKNVTSVLIAGHRFYDLSEKTKNKKWQSQNYGWKKLFEKMDQGNLDIVVIDAFVRSILPDEMARLQGFVFPEMSRENRPRLQKIFDKVAKCRRTECTDLKLTASEKQLLSQSVFHKTCVEMIESSNAKHQKVARERLYEQMQAEVGRYEFRVNPNMSQPRPGVFVLKMNAGDFAGGEQNFHSFMRYWQTDKNKVILETKSALSSLYRFVMRLTTNGRSFVDHEERTLNLYSNESLKTIAHELGHVMGFRDVYYTTYDFGKCEYKSEYNDNDLMSNHVAGRVGVEHWKTLKEKYPVGAAN